MRAPSRSVHGRGRVRADKGSACARACGAGRGGPTDSRDKKQQLEDREAMRLGTNKAGFGSVLAATEDFEGLTYRPTTKETRTIYELVLSFVHQFLGDQPQVRPCIAQKSLGQGDATANGPRPGNPPFSRLPWSPTLYPRFPFPCL